MPRMTAFVGRRSELIRFAGALEDSARAVLVIGEAGIGKTRLVEEATRRAGSALGMLTLRGGCLPLATKLPLLPIADVLRDLAVVDAGRLLRSTVDAAPPQVRLEVGRVLPQVAAALPVEDGHGEPWQTARLYAGIGELLAEVGRRRPVAVVIEDLHWADTPTLDFLTYLSQASRRVPLTTVVTCRSDRSLNGPVLDWLSDARRHADVEEILLSRLARREVGEQLAALVGRPPEPLLLDEVYARAEGNPFFAEQLVAPTRAPPNGPRLPTDLPTGLAALLNSRTRHLGADAHATLAALAVAGRPATETLLEGATDLTPPRVRAAVRELADTGLLAPPDAEGAYRPRHALLAEAVLSDVLPGERVDLHVRIAEALTALDDARLASEVAGHWAAASRPLDELRATLVAATTAEDMFAYADAARHLVRAIELSQQHVSDAEATGVDVPWLYVRQADALVASGAGADAARVADEAVRRYAEHPDRVVAAVVHHRAGDLRSMYSQESGLPLLARALELFEGTPPTAHHAEALYRYARQCWAEGRASGGLEALHRALEVATVAGAHNVAPRILSSLAQHWLLQGDISKGMGYIEEGWRSIDPASGVYPVIWLATRESNTHLKLGLLDDARRVALDGLDECRQAGRDRSFATAILAFNATEACLGLGSTQDAAAIIDPLVDGPATSDCWPVHLMRAEIDLLRGDLSAAVFRLEQIKTLPLGCSLDLLRELTLRSVELSVWTGQPSAALDEVRSFLGRIVDTDEVLFCSQLLALGMRTCADLAETGRALRDREGTHEALAAGDTLAGLREQMAADPFAEHPFVVTIPAERALWEAERSRLLGSSDPAAFQRAAEYWEGLRRPHRAAYAQWRHAEALLTSGHPPAALAESLRRSAAAAHGHAPLLGAVSALARRARIRLDNAGRQRAPRARRPQASEIYELTQRELHVLRLVGFGRSNREIGTELYMSPNTAGVHVSHILRKLGVSNRIQAAALAERAGILVGSDGEAGQLNGARATARPSADLAAP